MMHTNKFYPNLFVINVLLILILDLTYFKIIIILLHQKITYTKILDQTNSFTFSQYNSDLILLL